MKITYSDEAALASGTYTVQAEASGGVLTATLLGSDEYGEIRTEARVQAPLDALGDAHLVLRRLFDGVRQLDLARTQTSRSDGQPASRGQPWTVESDRTLKQDWLDAPADEPARDVIAELARVRDRTPGAIRSRLSRIGCDPDTVGARLDTTTE